ncbi:hypothetical protein RZS08_12615, partial [Arthrospira platensis SPKY1]|nr:hypothetical protein [Arthrospira platensis SPKY1]
MTPATLAELKTAWLAAKEAETKAQEERRAIEVSILALMPKKPEGTVTDKDAGVSVTYKVSRTVDTAAVQRDWDSLPEHATKALRWKAELDTKAFKALADFDEPSFQALSK